MRKEKEEEEERQVSPRIIILIAHSRFGFDIGHHESLMMHVQQRLMWKMVMKMMLMLMLLLLLLLMKMVRVPIRVLRVRVGILHSMLVAHVAAIQIDRMRLNLEKEESVQCVFLLAR